MKSTKFKNSEQYHRALRALEGKYNPPKYLGGAVKIDKDLLDWSRALEKQAKQLNLNEPCKCNNCLKETK